MNPTNLVCPSCRTDERELLIAVCNHDNHALCGSCFRFAVCLALQPFSRQHPLEWEYYASGSLSCDFCDVPVELPLHVYSRLVGQVKLKSVRITSYCPFFPCEHRFEESDAEAVTRHVLEECGHRFVCSWCATTISPADYPAHIQYSCHRVRCNVSGCNQVGTYAQLHQHVQIHNLIAGGVSNHLQLTRNELLVSLLYLEQHPHCVEELVPQELYDQLLQLHQSVQRRISGE